MVDMLSLEGSAVVESRKRVIGFADALSVYRAAASCWLGAYGSLFRVLAFVREGSDHLATSIGGIARHGEVNPRT